MLKMIMKHIDLITEKEFLHHEYEDCLRCVHDKELSCLFANEKLIHSQQVLGTGNYILKHEQIFQNKSADYIKLAKIACLLHDIGRFKEIKLLYQDPNSKHDHSFYSYERLKELNFSDPRILLPIKQHGHMRDALDNDTEFRNISDEHLKTEIREIYQLVKDADKIANFYLIKNNEHIFRSLFAKEINQAFGSDDISPLVWQSFERRDLIAAKDVHSLLDRLLQLICQVFEIYYAPTFRFLVFHQLIDNLLTVMRKHNPNVKLQVYIESTIHQHISNRLI